MLKTAHHCTHPTVYVAVNNQLLAQEIKSQSSCYRFNSKIVKTPTQLLEATSCTKPSVVILDVDFGGENNGVAIANTINCNSKTKVPIFFISNNDSFTCRIACTRVNGIAYFTNPPVITSIIEKLEQALKPPDTSSYRILIIEDSKAQAYFIAATLESANMQTCMIHDPFQLPKQLVEFRPELIIMDIYLPKCTGLELANVIRQQDSYDSIPIVFLSCEKNLSRQLSAMMLGGDEFLTKPIEPNHLVTAIKSRAKRARLLRGYMIKDSLTGLLNHTNILEQLDIEISRSLREKTPLCFAMLDIDHFKSVNDNFGHPTGDKVIKSLANLLQQRLRKTDIVGRYGGEEFAVVLPNTEIAQAKLLLEEIREDFSQIKQYSCQQLFNCHFSAGLACFDQKTKQKLPKLADTALYKAKSQGRNKIIVFKEGLMQYSD